MTEKVKIIECPRDAWQGLTKVIPSELKAEYLRGLISAGFKHIDAVSFVSPAAVPQMADSERVLELLQAKGDVEIIGIVVNAKGAERAIRTNAVQTVGFPYSISPEFLQRNQRQTPEQCLEALESIVELANNAELNVVAYISMAFGNPYGDAWSLSEVVDACDLLVESGVRQISLADTVGIATPDQIGEVVSGVVAAHSHIEFGVHLHARPENAPARILAAYDAGCRRFDAALGGLGGCPFAQDVLVGNIPTEILMRTLSDRGVKFPEIKPLDGLLASVASISHQYAAPVQ